MRERQRDTILMYKRASSKEYPNFFGGEQNLGKSFYISIYVASLSVHIENSIFNIINHIKRWELGETKKLIVI